MLGGYLDSWWGCVGDLFFVEGEDVVKLPGGGPAARLENNVCEKSERESEGRSTAFKNACRESVGASGGRRFELSKKFECLSRSKSSDAGLSEEWVWWVTVLVGIVWREGEFGCKCVSDEVGFGDWVKDPVVGSVFEGAECWWIAVDC